MKIGQSIRGITRSQNFKHGILYSVFSFANSGIGFILLLILARYLFPGDYGSLNLFTTFVTLLNIVISLSTTSYVAVAFFRKSRESLRQVIQTVFLCNSGMLALFSLMLISFQGILVSVIGINPKFLWMGLMISYLQVFNTVNLDIWRLEEKPIYYGAYSMSFALCNFVLTFWFIVGLQQGWEGRVYAWSLLSMLYFVISIIFLIRRKYLVFHIPDKLLIKETVLYALPLIPHSASFWLKQGLDRYIINYYYDQTVVGFFSFAMNLAAIIGIVGTAFNATNSVFIYKKLAEGYVTVKGTLMKQTRIMTGVFILVSLFVGVFAYSLIKLFLTRYNPSIIYIVPLCVAGFFQCVYLLWVNYLFFYKKTRPLMHITLSTAILQLLLSIWLTRYSPLYTAYISMIISALTMLLVQTISRKTLKITLSQEI